MSNGTDEASTMKRDFAKQCPVTNSLGRQCSLPRHHADDHSYPTVLITPGRLEDLETVNHPPHYGGDTTYEHWKVMAAWGLVSNAFLYNCTKYICRMGKKNDSLEDLKKAKWYLEKAIEQIETQQTTHHSGR